MKSPFFIILLGITGFAVTSCNNNTAESDEDTTTIEEPTPSEAVSNAYAKGTVYKIDASETVVTWEGYKPAMATTHTGTVDASGGNIIVGDDGKVVGGTITFDMNTITDNDLEGESKEKLEAHLKGSAEGKEDDFFNVSKYPTGKFEIIRVTEVKNDPDANYMVYGDLTLRNITNTVAFKAQINVSDDVVTATSPLFKIDRTDWDIKVLSKKFFENLKDGFVSDEFGLRIQLRASAAQNM